MKLTAFADLKNWFCWHQPRLDVELVRLWDFYSVRRPSSTSLSYHHTFSERLCRYLVNAVTILIAVHVQYSSFIVHQKYIVFQWSFDAQLMTSTVYAWDPHVPHLQVLYFILGHTTLIVQPISNVFRACTDPIVILFWDQRHVIH